MPLRRLYVLIWILTVGAASGLHALTSSHTQSAFIPNRGQWPESIRYRFHTAESEIQIGNDGFSICLLQSPLQAHFLSKKTDSILRGYRIDMRFVGLAQSFHPIITEENIQSVYYNFFQGNQPQYWKSGIHACRKIRVHQLYPGIDWIVYFNNEDQFEFDFEIEAGVSGDRIQMQLQGQDSMQLNHGALQIFAGKHIFQWKIPSAQYRHTNNAIDLPISYQITNKQLIQFQMPQRNMQLPIRIDPELVFSTYSGSTVDNFGFTATYDDHGNVYTGGIALEPSNIANGSYPVTPGAFQINWKNGSFTNLFVPNELTAWLPACDITLSKYSTDGTQLLFATYLGGSGNEHPHSLVSNARGELLVLGSTNSGDFPVRSFAFDTSYNGNDDIFIAHFSSDGTQLLASTYLGGSNDDGINRAPGLLYFYGDNFRGDIITAPDGSIQIASCTQSNDFPKATNGFQTAHLGAQDGLVYSFDSLLSHIQWGNFIGGDDMDALYSIDRASDGTLWLCGGTLSSNLITRSNAYKSTHNKSDSTDGMVMHISSNGQSFIAATYIGKKGYDQSFFLEPDINEPEQVWVCGQTENDWTSIGGAFSQNHGKQLIQCIDTALTQVLYQSVFGSGRSKPDMTINAFLVDQCGRVYLSGWGDADLSSGNVSGLTTTSDAFRKTTTNGDFYLFLLNRHAQHILYATYFGGTRTNDHVDGGTSRFDQHGIVYQSVCASCPSDNSHFISDFPTTPGVFSVTNKSPRCSNAVFKFDFRIRQAAFDLQFDTCARMIYLTNRTIGADRLLWILPDSSTQTGSTPNFQIKATQKSPFNIRLIVEPGTNCADTADVLVQLSDSIQNAIIPNVFTPGSDGYNDRLFFPGLVGTCDEFHIQILNRWGNTVYISNNPYEGWDGKDQSSKNQLSAGIYFYMIDVKRIQGKTDSYHGTITLIRP